jgi:hypothetical protein
LRREEERKEEEEEEKIGRKMGLVGLRVGNGEVV